MNDMRVPGLGLLNNEPPSSNSADATRDPARDFDAVMSRFSGPRAQQPAPDQHADAPARATNKANGKQGKTPAATTDRNSKPTAEPVERSKAKDGEEESPTASTDAVAADPLALVAAVAEAAQLAGQNPTAATPANPAPAQPAEKETKAAGAPSAVALDVLAGQVTAATGRAGEKAGTETRAPKVGEDEDNAPVAAGPSTKNRAPMAAKDTLRFDAPVARKTETQADVAQRFPSIANAVAQAAANAPCAPSAETASQAIAAAVASTNNTSTYSIAHATVATPVGTAGFANELSQRVVVFAGQKVQRAEISVTPAELGPIGIAIEVRGHEATLAFSAANHTTRAAIEDALPRLREMLSAQGLQLAGTHVGSEPRRDPYRPARNEKNALGGTGRADNARDGVAAVSPAPGEAIRRRLNLIDIEV